MSHLKLQGLKYQTTQTLGVTSAIYSERREEKRRESPCLDGQERREENELSRLIIFHNKDEKKLFRSNVLFIFIDFIIVTYSEDIFVIERVLFLVSSLSNCPIWREIKMDSFSAHFLFTSLHQHFLLSQLNLLNKRTKEK